jgi:sortase A
LSPVLRHPISKSTKTDGGTTPAHTALYQALAAWRFETNSSKATLLVPAPEQPSVAPVVSHAVAGSVLGRLKIPRIGMSVMVLEGIDGRTLRLAIGHIPATPLPGHGGNVAIAGHRDTFFRPLQNLHKNDEITLETSAGAFRYRVEGLWIVAPDQVEVLDPTAKPSLTLVTRYPFHFIGAAPYRFIVRARQIGRPPTS